jgi:hypothetical protein
LPHVFCVPPTVTTPFWTKFGHSLRHRFPAM